MTADARAHIRFAVNEPGDGRPEQVPTQSTGQEWSVRYPDGFVDGSRFTEAGARQRAAELDGEVVYRVVGPWQSAETPTTDQRAGGCPQPEWDGPYQMRCGLGGDTGVCRKHGPFRNNEKKEQG
ncbi:hypothetical protein ABZY58_11895 [Micromonospora tulbaghiae]|uniref:hypothetical protein n=1 Tax=Micromonospora tulbaghiae TaxID=479978 RepID=UPI0033A6F19A